MAPTAEDTAAFEIGYWFAGYGTDLACAKCSAGLQSGCRAGLQTRTAILNAKSLEALIPMSPSDNELARLFLESSRTQLLAQYLPRLRECVAPLTTEQVWWRTKRCLEQHRKSTAASSTATCANGWLQHSKAMTTSATVRLSSLRKAGSLPPTRSTGLAPRSKKPAKSLSASPQTNYSRPTRFRATTRGASTLSTMSLSTSACTTARSCYITKSMLAKDLGFYKELNKTGRAS